MPADWKDEKARAFIASHEVSPESPVCRLCRDDGHKFWPILGKHLGGKRVGLVDKSIPSVANKVAVRVHSCYLLMLLRMKGVGHLNQWS